jgi:hypothetical protein
MLLVYMVVILLVQAGVQLACFLLMYRGMRVAGRSVDREGSLVAELSMQLMEKLTMDPEMAARLHARERMYRQGLQASLEREALRREAPPPVANMAIQDPDGVPAANVEDARFQ